MHHTYNMADVIWMKTWRELAKLRINHGGKTRSVITFVALSFLTSTKGVVYNEAVIGDMMEARNVGKLNDVRKRIVFPTTYQQ